MDDCIARLMSALEEKEAACGELLHILDEERQCLMALDVPGIAAAAKAKEDAMAELGRLTDECRLLLFQSACEYGLPGESTLGSLIERVPSSRREGLRARQSRLVSLANRIRETEAVNGGMITASLGLVERSIGFFNARLRTADTYGGGGQMVEERAAVRIVCEEV